mmetsp:Transcript_27810/g.81811  ORF Transcript_27810/g.81811 Transcript_27810/m.81811 type:complete len:241 (+) Transcript_27810:777-1499(+)
MRHHGARLLDDVRGVDPDGKPRARPRGEHGEDAGAAADVEHDLALQQATVALDGVPVAVGADGVREHLLVDGQPRIRSKVRRIALQRHALPRWPDRAASPGASALCLRRVLRRRAVPGRPAAARAAPRPRACADRLGGAILVRAVGGACGRARLLLVAQHAAEHVRHLRVHRSHLRHRLRHRGGAQPLLRLRRLLRRLLLRRLLLLLRPCLRLLVSALGRPRLLLRPPSQPGRLPGPRCP